MRGSELLTVKHAGSGAVLLAAFALSLALHAPTCGASHTEGDELVYLGLSVQMGWDLSGYSTRAVPAANAFPERIYRSELFPHPPLYPLLLKAVVGALRALQYFPENLWPLLALGLLFKWLAMLSLYALVRHLTSSAQLAALAALLASVAPVLTFSSTRLLIDAPFAALFLAALVALLLALERDGWGAWALAGLLFALFLNTKYQALGFLPVPALVVSATAVTRGGRAWLAARRGKLAVFALLVVAMGLPHYARLWWTYGSPWIGPLLVAERPSTNAFLLRHAARSHLHVWLTLVLLYPSCWIALFPTFWRQLRARIGTAEPALWPALLAAYTFAVVSLSTFNQERYWSIFELLSLGAFFVYAGQAQLRGRVLAAWLSLALLCMGGSSYLCAVAQPGVATARIKPLAVALSPAVAKWYDDVN